MLKKGGQILFTCKAFNGRVVLEWLSGCISDLALRHPEDDRLALLASCSFLGLGIDGNTWKVFSHKNFSFEFQSYQVNYWIAFVCFLFEFESRMSCKQHIWDRKCHHLGPT